MKHLFIINGKGGDGTVNEVLNGIANEKNPDVNPFP